MSSAIIMTGIFHCAVILYVLELGHYTMNLLEEARFLLYVSDMKQKA